MNPVKVFEDKNKLVFQVDSKSTPGKQYNITVTRNPQRVHCECDGFFFNKYCQHLKDNKEAIQGFIADKDFSFDMRIGSVVKAHVYHGMSKKQLGEKQQVVLACLKENPDGLTDKGISLQTGLSLSCVNGRRNELMHMGLVMPYTIITYVGEEESIPNIVWGISGG